MTTIPAAYRTPKGLTPERREQFLAKPVANLGTIEPDGAPHLTTLLFGLSDDDRVLLPSVSTTRKARNIERRPTVSVLSSDEMGWVSCTGQACLIDGDEARQLNEAVYERVFTKTGMAIMGDFLREHEDITIEVAPSKWLSWSGEASMEWILARGVDLAQHQGPWFKTLAEPQW